MTAARVVAAAGVVAAAVALVLVAGCGDRDLWARYRAEQMLWQAERLAGPALSPSGTREGATARRAQRAFDRIVAAFPASVWGDPRTLTRPIARDVARLAGAAALRRAALEERAGRDDEAASRYAAIASGFGEIDSVAIEATAARARCLDRLGRDDESAAAWRTLAARSNLLDDAGVHARPLLLQAPTEATRLLVLTGRAQAADTLARHAIATFTRAALAVSGRRAAAELWLATSDLHTRLGEFAEARAALRHALADTSLGALRGDAVLALAERSRDERQPDSAAAYARWAVAEFPPRIGWHAELAVAKAWEARGVADSALAVYKRLIESLPVTEDLSAEARFDRGLLLERLDRWEAARPEFRTLATLQPTHPLGIEALVQIVRHYAVSGEQVLAGIESRHALETFQDLLGTQGDPDVRERLALARGEVLALTGRAAQAARELREEWERSAWLPLAARAGWRAARLADSALARPADAQALYRDLARRARDPEVRRLALARSAVPTAAATR